MTSGRRISPDPVVRGIALGYAADIALGDPRRWHPVAGFGRAASWVETRSYAPSRMRGVAHEAALVTGAVIVAAALNRGATRLGARVPLVAAVTWTVLGGRSLEREALAVHRHLVAGNLPAARDQIRNLVGRDPEQLTASELSRACVESVAENCSDAVVAPLVWGSALGVPGLVGYRAVNTLDAMVGHRSDRYRQFGWAAARVDDAANWIPARLAVALTVLCAPVVGGSPRDVVRIARRDSAKHPSPNAGPIEAAFAAALGVRLGGENVYDGALEDRGTLGDGAEATPADIPRAVMLARAVGLASVAVVVVTRLAVRAAIRRPR